VVTHHVTHHTQRKVKRHHAVQHAKPKPKPTTTTQPSEVAPPTENTVAPKPVHVVPLAQHKQSDGVNSTLMALASLVLLVLALATLSLTRIAFGVGGGRQSV
jgi:hypothetical protein